MSKTDNVNPRSRIVSLGLSCLCLSVAVTAGLAEQARALSVPYPVVLTQLPEGTEAQTQGPLAHGMLRADFGQGARLLLLQPDSSVSVLSRGFHSACDPAVSFDGTHLLFAGKKTASDPWHIFEMSAQGADVRQVTQGSEDHRSPGYQPTFYTIVSPKPWYQLTFVKTEKGTLNECGVGAPTNLYSSKLDGSALRRLTYNLSSDMDPTIMPDGRLLLASWQRSDLNRGPRGRISLFGVNIDGTDYAAFCGDRGKRIKHMPCTTAKGLAVFVESESVPWDGAGTLAAISLRRPLHDYRTVTRPQEGLFHSPSALPGGDVLVSRRSADGSDTHGLFKLNPTNGQCERLFDSPDYHEMQAQAIVERQEPDGRSSIVTEEDPHGKLYCLNVNQSDFKDRSWHPQGTAKRLRILEGVALTETGAPSHGMHPLARRRILEEIDIIADGSFNVEIPGSVPIELQTLDADGMALRTCAWIWAKNHEPRGCIGCHEDGELTPENVLIGALTRTSTKPNPAAKQTQTVDFRRDVMPIIADKCARCHDNPDAPVRLTGEITAGRKDAAFNQDYRLLLTRGATPGRGRYVHPGSARTSPVIWHLFGRNTSRPWDGDAGKQAVPSMPANPSVQLTDQDRRTFVTWIDLGALWDGLPASQQDHVPAGGPTQ
ncbi:MAG: hypothetical protein GY809_18370 [Planctomycetes bacterium]|nr:hypothetical protein [Planctomycetota bacterium]